MTEVNNLPIIKNIKNINNEERISIESLNILGSYSLIPGGNTNSECSLCRRNLLAPSFEDLQKGNLNIVNSLGKCDHIFHKACIDAYCKKSLSCPIDGTTWDLKRIVTHSDYIKKKLN